MSVSRTPLYQQVYESLREGIATGRLEPGARIDVQTVADEMDISRTPVREAIRQLIQEGLLKAERDGRARVYRPSPRDIAEIYVARLALEASAAELVAVRRPACDLSSLIAAHERSKKAYANEDWEALAAATTDFHDSIIELSENNVIIRILNTMRIHIMQHRSISMHIPERRDQALSAHEEIIKLLQEGDACAVRERVISHMMSAARFALTTARMQPDEDSPSVQFLLGSQQRE